MRGSKSRGLRVLRFIINFLLLLCLVPCPLLLSHAEVVFLHIHKGAGTFVCDMIKAQRGPTVSLAPSQLAFGKNCNLDGDEPNVRICAISFIIAVAKPLVLYLYILLPRHPFSPFFLYSLF